MKSGCGRIHILAKEIEKNEVYVDVHWDALIHFIFFGVDYARRPEKVCSMIIKKMEEKEMKWKVVGGTNWFSRRNKAIIKGLKIRNYKVLCP